MVRPDFELLMSRLESGASDGVWIYGVSRFSRKMTEGERLVAAASRGILLWSQAGVDALPSLRSARLRQQPQPDEARPGRRAGPDLHLLQGPGVPGCGNNAIRATVAEEAVFEAMRARLGDPRRAEAMAAHLTAVDQTRGGLQNEISRREEAADESAVQAGDMDTLHTLIKIALPGTRPPAPCWSRSSGPPWTP